MGKPFLHTVMGDFMDVKQRINQAEQLFLSPYAVKSCESKGREREISPCPMRTDFQRDRDRIIHCKSFRRLKHKTQVFLSPEGDHYRTRLTHTLEVAQIARTIARCLALNEDLTEAIALGHDLGHTPFGHTGEKALNEYYPFLHNVQSLRVVEKLENNFLGMNLTFEVRDGILHHTASGTPATLEGKVVSLADRIAYINHDIDDALRAGVLDFADIPKRFVQDFGTSCSQRVNTMVADVCDFSQGKQLVDFSPACKQSAWALRDFLFQRVYLPKADHDDERKATNIIRFLFEYFFADQSRLPTSYQTYDACKERRICDYIASLTDRFALKLYEQICIPRQWAVL